MIRILHVLGGLQRGGAETMVMNLYREINREEIQFDFIIHTTAHQEYYDEIIKLGGLIYCFPKIKSTNLLSVKNIWEKFFFDHHEYRILHSHIRSYASLYFPIAKKYGVKTIIHSHSTSNGKGIKAFVKNVFQYPLRYQADYFFSCSKEAGKWLFGKKVIESNKYYIIKNAIDTKLYRYNPEIRKEYRKKLNIGKNYTYIHIGRFDEVKNHVFLINVFFQIQKIMPDSLLILLGDGDLRSNIEKQIAKLNLYEKVRVLGTRGDVANILQAADCLLFPSVWEGLGMAAIEGQAAGIPCICSNKIPSVVAITNLCTFLPLDNTATWVDIAIKTKHEHVDLYQKIVDAGYDIHKTVKWLEKFYKKIIGEKSV